MTDQSGFSIVLFAYNRPAALQRTARSLRIALDELSKHAEFSGPLRLLVAIDGPRSNDRDREAVRRVEEIAKRALPEAEVVVQKRNRSLPAHLVTTLDALFLGGATQRVICLEDDIEMSSTVLLALLTASVPFGGSAHVIGAAPQHRDGSLEHQALLLNAASWTAARPLLINYINHFNLDGAVHEGAYGSRDHAAISAWSAEIAATAGLPAPGGTSQDRMRELAWRTAGVPLVGIPMRLVKHRGYWGQHNTPWYALRTGQLWQRLDRRPWTKIKAALQGA